MEKIRDFQWQLSTAFRIEFLLSISLILGLNYCFAKLTHSGKKTWLDDVPTIGLGPWPFGRLVGMKRFVLNMFEDVEKGFRTYGQHGKVFRMPLLLTEWVYILPFDFMKEIRNKSNDILSILEGVEATMGIESTHLQNSLASENWHAQVMSIYPQKYLHLTIPNLEDELSFIIDRETRKLEAKSKDKDGWFTFNRDNVLSCVSAATNRNFIGLPWSRDESVTEIGKGMAVGALLGGMIAILIPRRIRHWFTPFLNLPNRIRCLRLWIKLRPMLKERIAKTIAFNEAKAQGLNPEPLPIDLIQLFINFGAQHRGHPSKVSTWDLTVRILVFNFAAVHTTTVGTMHLLTATVSHRSTEDSEPGYLIPLLQSEFHETYKKEVLPELETGKRVVTKTHDVPVTLPGWTLRTLSKLTLLDSLLRETFRTRFPPSVALLRRVMDPTGLTLSNGMHFPKGTLIGFPGRSAVRAEEGKEGFDPFRFKREVDACESEEGKVAFASTSPNGRYIPFGSGKHACPGRYFAVNEIKLLVKELLLNYEIETLEEWPDVSPLFIHQLDNIGFKGFRMRRKRAGSRVGSERGFKR